MLVEEHCNDEKRAFCCRGCRGAYLLITGTGLGDFYRRRECPESGLGEPAFQGAFHDSPLSRFVYPYNDCSAIDIIIDGIRCASCVWLTGMLIDRPRDARDGRLYF